MKVIRMTPDAIRAWKNNVSSLVDEEGRVVRRVSPEEDRVVGLVMKEARKSRKKQLKHFALPDGDVNVEVTVKRLGPNESEFSTEAFIIENGGKRLRFVSGRDVICARLLEQHGECQLRNPNGTICKVVRDPRTTRPTFKESLQIAPKPENCSCVNWGVPHPGTHYPTCPYNKIAPPDERAPGPPTESEMESLPPAALGSLARPEVVTSVPDHKQVVVEAEPLDSPDECRNDCLRWDRPVGKRLLPGQHHPMCYFFAKWRQKTSQERAFWLVDVSTGKAVRRAEADEVALSDTTYERTGSRLIQIDEVSYLVTLEGDLPKEERGKR